MKKFVELIESISMVESAVEKKEKVVKMRNKKTGREISVISNAIAEYEEMGYELVEGCGSKTKKESEDEDSDDEDEIKEGASEKKEKVIRMKHKESGKEIVVVATAKDRYVQLGYELVEGCGSKTKKESKDEDEIKEGALEKKEKVVRMKHKESGKEIVVVSTAKDRYVQLGYELVEGYTVIDHKPIPREDDYMGRFQLSDNNETWEIYPIMPGDNFAKEIKATHQIIPIRHILKSAPPGGTSGGYLRYAKILKTVVYVAVDESPEGGAVWEKWKTKNLIWKDDE
jgi:hypothetical protein